LPSLCRALSGGNDASLVEKEETMHFRLTLSAIAVAMILAASALAAGETKLGAFKTPSGNIVCFHSVASARDGAIGCGIQSGLQPAPKNTCTKIDYSGKRMSLRTTGPAVVDVCASDPGPFLYVKKAPVLGYGSTWRGGGIVCASRQSGLTCTNRSGHGFFLSRPHSYRF
jgi:hypothetical protein